MKSIAKAEALLRSRIEYIISQALSGWELWEIGNRRREALCLMGFLGSHDKKAKFKRKTAGSTAVIGFRAVLGAVP